MTLGKLNVAGIHLRASARQRTAKSNPRLGAKATRTMLEERAAKKRSAECVRNEARAKPFDRTQLDDLSALILRSLRTCIASIDGIQAALTDRRDWFADQPGRNEHGHSYESAMWDGREKGHREYRLESKAKLSPPWSGYLLDGDVRRTLRKHREELERTLQAFAWVESLAYDKFTGLILSKARRTSRIQLSPAQYRAIELAASRRAPVSPQME